MRDWQPMTVSAVKLLLTNGPVRMKFGSQRQTWGWVHLTQLTENFALDGFDAADVLREGGGDTDPNIFLNKYFKSKKATCTLLNFTYAGPITSVETNADRDESEANLGPPPPFPPLTGDVHPVSRPTHEHSGKRIGEAKNPGPTETSPNVHPVRRPTHDHSGERIGEAKNPGPPNDSTLTSLQKLLAHIQSESEYSSDEPIEPDSEADSAAYEGDCSDEPTHSEERIGEAVNPGPPSDPTPSTMNLTSLQRLLAQISSDSECNSDEPIESNVESVGSSDDDNNSDEPISVSSSLLDQLMTEPEVDSDQSDGGSSGADSSLTNSAPTSKRGRPITSNLTRSRKARERYKAIKAGAPTRKRGRPPIEHAHGRLRRARQLTKEKILVQNTSEAFGRGSMQEGSELQLASMQTKFGRTAFAPVAAAVSESSTHAQVGRNVCTQLRQVGRSHMSHMVRWCAAGVNDMDAFCEVTGLTKRYVRSTTWGDRTQETGHSRIFTENYPPNTTRNTAVDPNDECAVNLFLEHTHQASGAKTETRQLSLSNNEVAVLFYAEYPRRLRMIHYAQPSILDMIEGKEREKKLLTRFEKSLRSAVYTAREPDHNEEREYLDRTKSAQDKYKLLLDIKRTRTLGVNVNFATKQKLVKRECQDIAALLAGAESDEDCGAEAEPFVPTPMTQRRFWRLLHARKIRWTRQVNPTECPIHDNGPQQELELKALETKVQTQRQTLEALRNEIRTAVENKEHSTEQMRKQEKTQVTELGNLYRAVRILRDNVSRYHTHLKQFEVCRAVVKRIEANLVPGECVLYRDFVALYNCEGNKVQNLVLVVLWRKVAGEPIRVFKFNNYCDDKNSRSADAYYVADVFDFYFGQGSHHCTFFQANNITKIFISGDHGPHFSSIQTIFNETTIYSRYGIVVEAFSLCSYHAYNR